MLSVQSGLQEQARRRTPVGVGLFLSGNSMVYRTPPQRQPPVMLGGIDIGYSVKIFHTSSVSANGRASKGMSRQAPLT